IQIRYEYPMEIDLQKYLSPEADRSKPHKYLLYSVLVHVLDNNYGGDKYTNAYILVYIRESDIDDVLSPMLPEDIPEHLQKRIDEQKRKETEEHDLYLCAT
ncbi:6234_t:CDS:2, partial [Scutellospora calospora]